MKKLCKKSLVLLSIPFLIMGCNKQEDDEILRVGFENLVGQSGPTPAMEVGLEVKRQQPLQATLQVYPGKHLGFNSRWFGGNYGIVPEKYAFVLERRIHDVQKEIVERDHMILDDFLDEEKYYIITESMEGVDDGYICHFKDYIVDTIDFSSIDLLKGGVTYFLDIYDLTDHEDILENNGPFTPELMYPFHAGSGAASVKFEKHGEEMRFIEYYLPFTF